jgi:hypothetical protein
MTLGFTLVPKVAKLSDKAIEAKLVIRRTTLVKRDNTATALLRNSDASATAFTKLFRKEGTPIWKLMKAVSEVYAYHCDNTERCGDKRLVTGANIFEYTQGLRHLIAVVDTYKAQVLPVYDQLVLDDIAYRNYGKVHGAADASQYPSAIDFGQRISFDFRMVPLPNEEHPLFDMDESDKEAVRAQFSEMMADTNNATIERMLKPLEYLTTRLGTYTGAKGERFHTSVLDNVLDGCRLARKLAIDASPALLAEIAEIERMVQGYTFSVDSIKEDEATRNAAKANLEAASRKLSDYFA